LDAGWRRFDLDRQSDFQVVSSDPDLFLRLNPRRVAIDEAQGFPGLDHDRFRQFLHMLGSLSGTVLNLSDVARTLAVSQPTARDYVEIAHGTFVWRRLPAYTGNPLKRAVRHPKGYLRDTGLLHHLLRIPDLDTLLGHPAMGKSWEGLVIEELLRGLNGRGIAAEASHYRTSAGGEVDLVLEGDFGLLPIAIKHAQTVRLQELQALNHFLTDTKCPLGLVINNDERPRFYTERILGVPFACL
jgi:predicted AAA+ superfamily ATPase